MSLEYEVQRPKMRMDKLTKKIEVLNSRLKELKEYRIKISLKIVITNKSIDELKMKQEKIDEKIFESLRTDYVIEFRKYEKEEENLIRKINLLEEELMFFEEYRPLLEKYESMENEMKDILEKLKVLEKKLNYM
jgi:chromosome segregation ATPase